MHLNDALAELRAAADATRKPGMARVGIRVDHALGVSVPSIRRIAKRAGADQPLAAALWDSGIHEARMLATLVAVPAEMSDEEVDAWVGAIDSWDVGDALADTFAMASKADVRIRAWSRREEPFVKRCAFAMIARKAVGDKTAPDGVFERWYPTIQRGSRDDRNEVKKAVSWALRQIGKRNKALHASAIAQAERMLEDAIRTNVRSGRWIARDVLRELHHPDHLVRLGLAE